MKKLKINRKVVANLSKTVQSNVIGGDGTFNTDDLKPIETIMCESQMCQPTDWFCQKSVSPCDPPITVECPETKFCVPQTYTTNTIG